MSRSLNYFPPNGTKYKWGSKVLNYSPWLLNMVKVYDEENSTSFNYSKLSCLARVDKYDEGFYYSISFTKLNGEREEIKAYPYPESALETCLEAEKVAKELLSKEIKPWMKEALLSGWRAP